MEIILYPHESLINHLRCNWLNIFWLRNLWKFDF